MPDQEGAPGEQENNKSETEREASTGQMSSPEENASREKRSFLQTNGVVTVRLETIANILTAAVAIAAILLSVWEGIENRRHNRLSVLPHLEPREVTLGSATPIEHEAVLLPIDIDSLYVVGYALENSGLGPAVLEKVLIFRDGEAVYNSAQSGDKYYLQAVERDLDRLPFGAGLLKSPYFEGEMLRAGEMHRFATVIIPYSTVNRDSLDRWPPEIVQDEVLERRSFVFCYCSVYGEDCDVAFLGAEPPVEDACGF